MDMSYPFNDNELIEKIHTSSFYGCFFEVGASQPIAKALFDVENASETIHIATSPYSTSVQDDIYPLAKDMRAVCAERIEIMLDVEMARYLNKNINLFVATSFTLPKNACAHGYIGIAYRSPNSQHDIRRIYHITLPKDTARHVRIDLIGHIGIRLIGLFLGMRQYPTVQVPVGPFLNFIDDVRASPSSPTLRDELIELYYHHQRTAMEHKIETVMTEHALVFNQDGNAERFESLCRRNNEIAPYKGSFSILHNMHTSMAKLVNKSTKNMKRQVIFTICIQTYGKGTVNINDLQHRISMILESGYPVMLLQNPLFRDNFAYLRTRTRQPIVFLAGADTLARISGNRWIDQSDVRFAWFPRKGFDTGSYDPTLNLLINTHKRFDLYDLEVDISSRTLLRSIEHGDVDAIEDHVPPHVYQYYTKNRNKPRRMFIHYK